MVVVYRVTPLTWWMGKNLVRTPFYSMVNLVAGRRIVPELIQRAFRPEAVAREAQQLLESQALREQMQQGLQEVVARLQPPNTTVATATRQKKQGPIQRSASAIESMLKEALPLAAHAK